MINLRCYSVEIRALIAILIMIIPGMLVLAIVKWLPKVDEKLKRKVTILFLIAAVIGVACMLYDLVCILPQISET